MINRNNKGISLIALIVTIVILLILAAITISLVLDKNGIIENSKNAINKANETDTKTTNILGDITNELKDQEGDNNTDLVGNSMLGITATPRDWTNTKVTITVSKKENAPAGDIYVKQNNGAWVKGTKLTFTDNGYAYAKLQNGDTEVTSLSYQVSNFDKTAPTITYAFCNEDNVIEIKAKDEESGVAGYAITTTNVKPTTFKTVTKSKELDVTEGSDEISRQFYIWVKDSVGNVNTEHVIAGVIPTVTKILKIGDYIKYNPSSTSYTGLWRVLYKDDTNGIQMISAGCTALLKITGTSGFNTLVSTLNTEAAKYGKDSNYVSMTRSVGTDPINPTSTNTSMTADTNYNKDYNQLSTYNMAAINAWYFMGSRYIYEDSNGKEYNAVIVRNTGSINGLVLHCVHTKIATQPEYDHDAEAGVRPVLKIVNTLKVIGGSGTSAKPYILSNE